MHFNVWYVEHILLNCPCKYTKESDQQQASTCANTEFYDAILRH